MWHVHFDLEDGSAIQSVAHSTWESALKEACGKLQMKYTVYVTDPRGQRIGRDKIVELCRNAKL
jgi:hypothetical protein